MAIKVDLKKVNDRIDLRFLEDMLYDMKILSNITSLIMAYVLTNVIRVNQEGE